MFRAIIAFTDDSGVDCCGEVGQLVVGRGYQDDEGRFGEVAVFGMGFASDQNLVESFPLHFLLGKLLSEFEVGVYFLEGFGFEELLFLVFVFLHAIGIILYSDSIILEKLQCSARSTCRIPEAC